MINPTIVINAYNRPQSLRRLLYSLDKADMQDEVNIVFSLEYGAHTDVVKQVNEFDWKYGRKEILTQEKKLGLVGHFLFCGDLTNKYGTIIYLEDDLFVGRTFYTYAQEVLVQYGKDEALAGFSLNALWFNGYLHLPFKPIDDGNPCFFLQVPWYQGQIYTQQQWSHFRHWYNTHNGEPDNDLQMHSLFKNYQISDDWFPIKSRYLIENKKYYCFPRTAHCVNFGDSGTHFEKKTNFFQTELALGVNNSNYKPISACLAVYDSFYELDPAIMKSLAPALKEYDFELDLNGTKDLSIVKTPYVITSVKPQSFIKQYGLEMRPQELNIIYEVAGDHFYLTQSTNVKNAAKSTVLYYNQFFYYNRFKLTKKQRLKIFLKGV